MLLWLALSESASRSLYRGVSVRASGSELPAGPVCLTASVLASFLALLKRESGSLAVGVCGMTGECLLTGFVVQYEQELGASRQQVECKDGRQRDASLSNIIF